MQNRKLGNTGLPEDADRCGWARDEAADEARAAFVPSAAPRPPPRLLKHSGNVHTFQGFRRTFELHTLECMNNALDDLLDDQNLDYTSSCG